MTHKPPMPACRHALAVALLALSCPLSAHDYYTASFQIVHPWTHAAPAGTRTAGVYMRFVDVSADDRLLSASTGIAEKVELRIPPRPDAKPGASAPTGIELSAGRDLSLSASTAHLVLQGVKTRLHEGRQYPLLLVFEKAGEVPVDFVIGAH